MTMRDGGPFVTFADKSNTHKKWERVIAAANTDRDGEPIDPPVVRHVTFYDLRRTGITRALLGGMPPVAVQRLSGHADIKTTMDHYVEVTKQDVRETVAKLCAG